MLTVCVLGRRSHLTEWCCQS